MWHILLLMFIKLCFHFKKQSWDVVISWKPYRAPIETLPNVVGTFTVCWDDGTTRPSQHAVNEDLSCGSLEFSTHSQQSRPPKHTREIERGTSGDGIIKLFPHTQDALFKWLCGLIPCYAMCTPDHSSSDADAHQTRVSSRFLWNAVI